MVAFGSASDFIGYDVDEHSSRSTGIVQNNNIMGWMGRQEAEGYRDGMELRRGRGRES